MGYKLEELIDIKLLQNLQEKLNLIYPFTTAIVDNDGKILTSVAWQDICTKFHRVHPECEKECIKSDLYIMEHIHGSESAISYQCPHGLIDNAYPIIINGDRLGNFFAGQFFLKNPDLDFFKKRAEKYGFDETSYLEAVAKVPIWSKERVAIYLDFIKGFIELIAGLGLKNLKEIDTGKILKESEEHNHKIIENSLAGYFFLDSGGIFRKVNLAWLRMHKYDNENEIIGKHFFITQIKPEIGEAQNVIEKILSGEQISTVDFSRLCKDGSIGYHSLSCSRVLKGDEVSGMEGFLIDTTFNRNAELIQKKMEEKYSNLFRNMITGFALHEIILNSEGQPCDYRFLEVNPVFERLTGLRSIDLIGHTIKEIMPDSEQYWIDTYGKVALSGDSVQFENFSGSLGRYYQVVAYSTEPKLFATIFIDITESKQREKVLRENEKRLTFYSDNSPMAIIEWDSDNKITLWTGASEKIFGWTSEEIVGRKLYDPGIIFEPDIPFVKSSIEKLKNGKNVSGPSINRNYRKDGSIITCEWYNSMLKDQDGKMVSVLAQALDITERENAEKALKQQNISLSKLNKFALGLANLSFDDDLGAFIAGQVKEITGAALATFSEYDRLNMTLTFKHIEIEPLLLENISTLIGERVQYTQSVIDQNIYSELISEKIKVYTDLSELSFGIITKSEGEKLMSLLNIDRFIGLNYIIDGKLYGTSLFAISKGQADPPREILENFIHLVAESLQRKTTEKLLRESEEKFRTLFEKASDGIFLMDSDKNLVLVNDSFAQMHGYSLQEMINVNLASIDTPETYKLLSDRVKRVLDGETIRFEVTHFHKNRSIIALEVISSMLTLRGEKYVISLHRDVTECKEAAEELKRRMNELTNLNSELEQFAYANQELKQFAYTASHQLQEPIRTVSNYTQIIEEDYSRQLDENGLRHLHTIRDATTRMSTLINTLMEFSQLGRNRKFLRMDIHKLIENVVGDLNKMIIKSNAHIDVSDMPVLNVYEVEIRQLFQNLITNAIKFQKKDNRPMIRIYSTKVSDKWRFSVADNGIGIDKSNTERIFDIFQRLHASEEEFEGNGIGLAYCKKIIQMHYGDIWVESKEGEGSVFHFTIPDVLIAAE